VTTVTQAGRMLPSPIDGAGDLAITRTADPGRLSLEPAVDAVVGATEDVR